MSGTAQSDQTTAEINHSEDQANSNKSTPIGQTTGSASREFSGTSGPTPITSSLKTATETSEHYVENAEGPLLKKAEENKTSYAPKANLEEGLKPRISVIGVGGAGCNAITNMIKSELAGVDFFVANTDAQALEQSDAKTRIQLGLEATHGLGAGSHPEMGRASAEESIHDVLQHIGGSHMLFVTAGMGGGTGTGAAPIIAKAAREHGILTVGVVTKPFHFEGAKRMRVAEHGIEELQKYVDTLIVIPNQNLFRVANEKTTFVDAFKMADEVLYSGVRSVTDLMMKPGLINLDFADVKAVMGEMMGKAMMGTGEAEGEGRAIDAAEAAISSPLLDDVSMKGAKAVLINITGGMDMTLFEADEAANRIREEVDPNAHIIFGSTFDESLQGKIRVSCVATGIDAHSVVAASVSVSQPRSDTQIQQDQSPDTASSSKENEPLVSSSQVDSIEDELGMTQSEDATSIQPKGESSYDIYSSLRQDMKDIETATSPEVTGRNPADKPEAHLLDSNVGGTSYHASFTDQSAAQSEGVFQSSRPEPISQPSMEVEEEEAQGFFSRLMGRKKPSVKPASAPRLDRTSQPHTQQPAPRPAAATESDDLDVPAFLRRKDRH